MTYQDIRTELHAMRDQNQAHPGTVDMDRARHLVGKLQAMRIKPRRVRLSLRQLGLTESQLMKQRRERATRSAPTS